MRRYSHNQKRAFARGRRGLLLSGIALLAALCVISGELASAATVQSGKRLKFPASGVIDDDLVFLGRTCRLSGEVNGDAALFAERVIYNGAIEGALLSLGEEVTLAGSVASSVGAVGREIIIDGETHGSTFLMAELIEINPQARLHRDCFALSKRFFFDGSCDGDLVVGGELVVINGTVEGDAKIYSDRLEIRADAMITGDLIINPGTEPEIDDGAVILGDIISRQKRVEVFPTIDPIFPDFIWSLFLISSIFVVGLLMLLITGRHFHLSARSLYTRPARSAALSILGMGGSGALVGILALTLIGLPASMLIGCALLLFLWLFGQVYAAAAIGGLILSGKQSDSFGAWTARLFVGLLIIALILQIPVIGWLLYLILGLYGFGGFVSATLICRNAPMNSRDSGVEGATGSSGAPTPPIQPTPPAPAS